MKHKDLVFSILICLLSTKMIFAQSDKIDSLKIKAKSAFDSKLKVDLFNELAQSLAMYNLASEGLL